VLLIGGISLHSRPALASTGGSDTCSGSDHTQYLPVNDASHVFAYSGTSVEVHAELYQYYDLRGSVWLPANCFFIKVYSPDVNSGIDVAAYMYNDGGTYLASVAASGPGPVTSGATSSWTSNDADPNWYMRVRLGYKFHVNTNYNLYPAPPGTVQLIGGYPI